MRLFQLDFQPEYDFSLTTNQPTMFLSWLINTAEWGLGVLSGGSKAIFEHVERSAQTVQLSCVKNSTISKRTETSIHLSLVT
jgi:hypothetical protein